MIRHCVFVRFLPEVTAEHQRGLFAEIAEVKARVPGFLAVHAGSNVSPETGMDRGYAQGFIADFVDAAARDAYLADPGHQRTGAEIVQAAVGGVEGVLVFDLEIADPDQLPTPSS